MPKVAMPPYCETCGRRFQGLASEGEFGRGFLDACEGKSYSSRGSSAYRKGHHTGLKFKQRMENNGHSVASVPQRTSS